jgi:hypothetical protein
MGIDTIKCVGYDFFGRFGDMSINMKDENGKEIVNIKEYFD